MIIRKAFKFELIPNSEHVRKLKQFSGCARFVFNHALAWQKDQYEQDRQSKFSYTKIANLLPTWKKEHSWLKTCHSQVLQQSLKDLESAYRNFFRKQSNFPKFKKKGIKESIRFPQSTKLDENNKRIFIPKIGYIRYRRSQFIVGTIKNVTVSLNCGKKWFVSIQTEYEQAEPIHHNTEIGIGIDMGISRFATLSNGIYFKPLNIFKQNQLKLRKLQQQLSHKKKFSKNYLKSKHKISKLHHKIANSRKDYLHKISNEICKNHAMIYIEDLKVSNMSKSAKSGLNKSILDQSWREFRRQLEYKSYLCGGFVYSVDPKYTSQTCPCCSHVAKENRKTQANFECVNCGYKENADLVAALNILRVGHTRSVCEVNGAVMPSATETHRSELAIN